MRFISTLGFIIILFMSPVWLSLGKTTVLPSAVPPLIGFLVNNGDQVTNNRSVEVRLRPLKTNPSLIDGMQIGLNPDLSDASWQPYSAEPQRLILPEGDGEKHIYARFRDKAGNPSPIEQTSIILDTQPPMSADITINKGAQYTNDRLGRVYLEFDVAEAVEMQVNNTGQFVRQEWEAFSQAKNWNIEVGSGDGEKTVYARFKDAAGNVSEVFSQSIILDTKPPENGKLIIENGEKYLKRTKVKIRVGAKDADMVRLVDRNGGRNFEFQPNQEGLMHLTWEFDTLQGLKVLKAYFMDKAKNKTTQGVQAEYIYDTEAPDAPRVVIDNNNKYITDKTGKVTLQVFIKNNESNLKMQVSNDPGFKEAPLTSYTNIIRNWQVDTGKDGVKKVYARLVDEAENFSDAGEDDILLDRQPPEVEWITINEGEEWTIRSKVNLSLNAEDAVMMQISNNPNFTAISRWEKYAPKKFDWDLIPGDGEKTVYARFKDEAENVSEMVSASIKLDSRPPRGKLIANNDEKFTNDPSGITNLKILYDSDDVAGMQLSNTPDFSNVKLVPVETEINNWQLSEGDGAKTIFLRLKDKAGNFSDIITDNLILDRQPPQNCEISINNGAEWLLNENKKVALSLLATEANMMMVSNNPSFEGAEWMPFKTAISWTLEGPEGTHEVYAKFKDPAGNVSETVDTSIKSDFSPPKVNRFVINNDETYTNNTQKQVTLQINVEDATEMAVDNIPITPESEWEPVQSVKEWILSNEDGPKTVYARFRDVAGNVSAEHSDKIILDRVPPTECSISFNGKDEWLTDPDGKTNVYLKANGASEVIMSENADFSNASWKEAKNIVEWQVDVAKPKATVYAKFRDSAGNLSETVSSEIKVDVEPPKNAQIEINDGDKFLIGEDKRMKIDIEVEGAKLMKVGLSKSLSDAEWEPVGGLKEIVLLEGDGVKTVYAQFKDQAGNTSEVVSDDIIVDTTPPKIHAFRIDNGAEWTNNKEKKVTLNIEAEQATEMRIDHDPAFSNSSWEPYKPQINDYVLPGEDGVKTLFVRLKDEAGNVSQPIKSVIKLKRTF